MPPIITKQELATLATTKCVVTLHSRKVYDVTDFLSEHPGGGDIIQEYTGKDITDALKDPMSHMHSESAYEMLDDNYCIALLASDEEAKKLLTDDNRLAFKLQPSQAIAEGSASVTSEEQMEIVTDFSSDYAQNKFLDLNKPLLPQVLFASYNKEFYLEQIHKPRHYGKGSAPIFGNVLEPLSKTAWYVVPIFWVPLDIYCCTVALKSIPVLGFLPCYLFGLLLWTLVEYILHRFLFHIEKWLPDHPLAFTAHFLLHGVHHYLPMDRLRLVMPPAMFVILCTPLYHLCHFVFRKYDVSMSIFAGALMGYILYDIVHYSLHHTRLPQVMKDIKKHHLDHHYKDYDVAYGVTSQLWDYVFGTMVKNDGSSRLMQTYKQK